MMRLKRNLLPGIVFGLSLTAGRSIGLGQDAQTAASAPAASGNDAITVSGNHILRGGQPWIAHGVMLVAFVATPAVAQGPFPAAYAHYSKEELMAIKAWGADSVRFQISQPATDPQSPLHDADFVAKFRQAVLDARTLGLNVIVSVQDEKQTGEKDVAQLPDAGTQRVWQVLAPYFKDDPGVVYELLNEPQAKPTPEAWSAWGNNMDIMIHTVRRAGARNAVIADGLGFAEHLSGAPALKDPLNQVIYASHPYAHDAAGQTQGSWEEKFGDFAQKHPVMVTEWTSAVPYFCDDKTPSSTLGFLRFLQAKGIGLQAVTYDFGAAKKFGGITQDFNGTPSTYVGLKCGDAGYGPGKVIQDWYRTGVVPSAVE